VAAKTFGAAIITHQQKILLPNQSADDEKIVKNWQCPRCLESNCLIISYQSLAALERNRCGTGGNHTAN